MFKTTQRILGFAALSAVAAAGLYWWWTRLIVGTFAQCVSGEPPAGTDCLHGLQLYGAIGFAALAGVFLLIALVRGLRARLAGQPAA